MSWQCESFFVHETCVKPGSRMCCHHHSATLHGNLARVGELYRSTIDHRPWATGPCTTRSMESSSIFLGPPWRFLACLALLGVTWRRLARPLFFVAVMKHRGRCKSQASQHRRRVPLRVGTNPTCTIGSSKLYGVYCRIKHVVPSYQVNNTSTVHTEYPPCPYKCQL